MPSCFRAYRGRTGGRRPRVRRSERRAGRRARPRVRTRAPRRERPYPCARARRAFARMAAGRRKGEEKVLPNDEAGARRSTRNTGSCRRHIIAGRRAGPSRLLLDSGWYWSRSLSDEGPDAGRCAALQRTALACARQGVTRFARRSRALRTCAMSRAARDGPRVSST